MSSTVRLPYTDVPPDHPHAAAIDAATYFGLVEGDTGPDGARLERFRPDDAISRAEFVKILALALKIFDK